MRPATPPKFFLDTAIHSIDDLISMRPEKICYGHLGLKEAAVKMLNQHKEQLYLWENIIRNEIGDSENDDFFFRCSKILLAEDHLLAGFSDMEEDVKEREKFFLLNSIKGFVGYIENRT